MTKKMFGHIISHTHWDRAWYWTFEQTRVRLLDLMDDLLALMLHNQAFSYFVLDGQMVMVHDYLELRPERLDDVRALVQSGRLLVGPFYVLPDLFIPSGESLIRNLQAGHKAANALGPIMKFGYLPDSFGHPPQLPQILKQFGITGMLLSRGMGDEGESLGADFLWEAPDGSQVLVTHQVGGGYCNLAKLGRELEGTEGKNDTDESATFSATVKRMEQLIEAMLGYCPHGQLLLNNGCDHLPAQPEIPSLIAKLNQHLATITLVHSTPIQYQNAVRAMMDRGSFTARVFRGELRGSRYANILAGVLSARVDLKLQHHAVEAELLHWAEPWLTLAQSLNIGRDDRALLDQSWRLLLQCQPHDDICGCSIDAVHDDDMNRLARSRQIAEEISRRAINAMANHIEANPIATTEKTAAATRSGQPLIIFNPHPWPSHRVLQFPAELAVSSTIDQAPLIQRGSDDSALMPVDLPALGYTTLVPSKCHTASIMSHAVKAYQRGQYVLLENELIKVRSNNHGQVNIHDLSNPNTILRGVSLVDEADAGDTYDFASPPRSSVYFSTAIVGKLALLESGPWRGQLELKQYWPLPIGLSTDRQSRSSRHRRVPVSAILGINAGSTCIEFNLTIQNTVDDHRLRFQVNLPFHTAAVLASAPFQLFRRPIVIPPQHHWHQPPSPTQPFSDLLIVEDPGYRRGLAIFAPGLREYEARQTRRGTEILITLFRSVRWLSRDDLPNRQGHAGPGWEVQGARQLGTLKFRLALFPFSGNWIAAEVLRRYQEFAIPPRTIASPVSSNTYPHHHSFPHSLPPQMSFLSVEPSSVQLSSLVPGPNDSLHARLVNVTEQPVIARLRGSFHARPLNLDNNTLGPEIDLNHIPLRANEIMTLSLERKPYSGG